MNYNNYIICFIDMLGTSIRIKKFSLEELLTQYKFFTTLNISEFWHKSQITEFNNNFDCFIFSDSVIRTINIDQKNTLIGWSYCFAIELCQLADIQFKLLVGFIPIFSYSSTLMRGCLNLGKLFIGHENKIIFGEGIINCYKKESTIAKYPRIIVDDTLINKKEILNVNKINFKQYCTSKSIFKQQYKDTFNCIRKDFDGIYFLDYLKLYILTHSGSDFIASAHLAIHQHRTSIMKLSKEKIYRMDFKAKEKLFWLITYHNLIVDEYINILGSDYYLTEYKIKDFKKLKIITANEPLTSMGADSRM